MPRLKILQLADFRWYNASAHYALTISQALAKQGHLVFLGLSSNKNLPALVNTNSNLCVVDLSLSSSDPISWISGAHVLSQLIAVEEISVINAHSASAHALAAHLKSFMKNKFRLVRTRGEAQPPKNNFLNRYLYRQMTDAIIVPSSILVERYIRQFNFNPAKIAHIPLGISSSGTLDDSESAKLRRQMGINENESVVGLVGRLSPVKGHIYFIQSAKFVLEKFPRTKFIIASQNAQITKERLKRLAYQLGILDRFIFLGLVDNIHNVISTFDIGVVSSTGSETICRVLLEYMSAGKPVIGTRLNGIPDLIHDGKNGYLVPPTDSQELASAIIRILSQEEKRVEMGKYSKFLAETEYSLSTFANHTAEIYLRLLKE